MRRLLLATAVAIALVAWPSTMAAQGPDEPIFDRLTETFKKDYLSLGVLLQAVADFQVERTLPTENGFSIANFRLLLQGELDGGFGYFLQASFAGTPAILDARMSYRASPMLAFDVGQFKAPFSREFLTSAASIDFVNRSQGVTALAPGRQIGLQARFNDRRRTVAVSGGIFNGNGTTPNGNDNENLMYAGRVAVTPRLGPAGTGRALEVGVNVAHSDDQSSTFGGGFVTGFVGTRTHVGGDARLTLDRWLLSGELVYAELRPTLGIDRSPWGFHTTVGYMLSPKTQVLARFDGFDADAGPDRSDLLVLGFNAWPTAVTEFQVNYLIDTRDTAVDHHQLLVNFQFGF